MDISRTKTSAFAFFASGWLLLLSSQSSNDQFFGLSPRLISGISLGLSICLFAVAIVLFVKASGPKA